MPVNTTAWITAIVFGALMGWGLGRRGTDRRAVTIAAVATTAAGGIWWLTQPAPGTDAAMAAVSMTLGGAAAATLVTLTARRA